MSRGAVALALALAVTAPGTASAGGLARPNPISARGVGFGGAFAALADDVTALYYNPAALAYIDPQITVGGELVVAPRRYVPLRPDGTKGPAQATTPTIPLPVLGGLGRFTDDGAPSALTLGIGIWNSFGGKVAYEKLVDETTGMPIGALDSIQDAVIEVVPGFAYRFDEHLAIGAALRVGIGLFSVDATQMPVDSSLSAYGVGLSYTGGVLVTPIPALRIGLTWRAPMTIRTNGDGTVELDPPLGESETRVEHTQRWPQQVSLGVGVMPVPRLRAAAQLDWSGWGRVDVIAVEFPDNPTLDQRYLVDWNDSYTVRLGAEYAVSPGFAVRAGTYADTSAVPVRTIERQYLDLLKFGMSAGTSVRFGTWRVDLAVDVVLPGTVSVEDNRTDVGAWPERANVAPGDHSGSVYSLAFAVARTL